VNEDDTLVRILTKLKKELASKYEKQETYLYEINTQIQTLCNKAGQFYRITHYLETLFLKSERKTDNSSNSKL
jgi:DNA-binding PadR family transcriptional regulator